jgi:hypothetical protein
MIRSLIKKIRHIWHSDINNERLLQEHINLNHKLNYGLARLSSHTSNELSILCDIYGSDKGSTYGGGTYYEWFAHTYTPIYEMLFQCLRDDVKLVFECGIGTNNEAHASSMGKGGKPGASLRVWRDYFPNATIIGADVDTDILFEESRIFTGYIDQLSEATIDDFFSSVQVKFKMKFDIMIDDGLHTFEAGKSLFSNSFEHLKASGYYVIEDVELNDVEMYKAFFEKIPNKNQIDVKYLLMPFNYNMANNLIIIKKL